MVLETKEERCGEIIEEGYREYLNRKPDKNGFEHYFWLIYIGAYNNQMLIDSIKNSDEYKIKKEFRKRFNEISLIK